jgi:fermentation-respiration switch protein FrsA (DUF1100 family)
MTEQNRFTSEEVAWEVDGIPVRGTLSRPRGSGPFPEIVFVAGSGPTDRDWCTPLLPGTNGSGRLIADALTCRGFVTLRYDKRASGEHVRENIGKLTGKMSMQGHLDELTGAVDLLDSVHGRDGPPLFALTNSEGAIHALHYQLQPSRRRLAGLVLTGPPGIPLFRLLRNQVLAQISPLPDGAAIMERYDAAIASFMAGDPVTPDPLLPEGLQNLIRSLTTPVNLPFSRELLGTDPAELLAQVEEPVLVVIGKKDIQVDWKVDGAALEAAAKDRGNVTFIYPDNADHVLKYEEKPRDEITAAEITVRYNATDRNLDPAVLDAILHWLSEQIS